MLTDTQLYLSFSPETGSNQTDAISAVENCIQDIRGWMIEDKLMLNDDKTEFIIIGTQHRLSKVSIQSIKVGEVDVPTVTSARNLGTWFDSNLNMGMAINKTCSSAFYYLYNIRRIRKYLSKDNAVALVHAFITSRIDYCNSPYYGLPNYQLHKLQRVLNSSARLVHCASRFCHITPLLREMHWLPVRMRIEFKLLLITFKMLKGLAPQYLSELIFVLPPSNYNLRRNNNGILLSTSKFKSKKTLGDRAFFVCRPNTLESFAIRYQKC